MKTLRKLLLICLLAYGSADEAWSQIYVTVRPTRPVYVRPAPPSPRHIWIEEDWTGSGGAYVWHGGYWAEPPGPGYYYRPGRWRHTNRGYMWVGGRWSGGPHAGHPHRAPKRGRGHHPHGHGHHPHGR